MTVAELARRVADYRAGAAVSLMIVLGDRLGLYRAMRGAGPLTAAELAARAEGGAPAGPDRFRARWVEEWLRGQVAAGLVEPAGVGRFELGEAAATLLAAEDSPASGIGGFATVPSHVHKLDAVVRAFRSGHIDPEDWVDPDGGAAQERVRGPWVRGFLVPVVVPAVGGLAERLAAGARGADLCCGSALALRELAAAYPGSEFVGFDRAEKVLHRATAQARAGGLRNLTLHSGPAETVADHGPFDLLLTSDAMHELGQPERVARAARAAIADDGVWLIEEPRAAADDPDQRMPAAAVAAQYAVSVLVCLPRSLPEAGADAPGALGLTADRVARLTAAAGFTRFRVHDFGSPLFRHFEVRP